MLTKDSFTRDDRRNLLRLFNIIEVQWWDVLPEPAELLYQFRPQDPHQICWHPKTTSQTCWPKETSHVMSGTIFFVGAAISANVWSDPIRKQCAMSQSVQESYVKEGSAVAKPKPMTLNLSSMRKILSQGVRAPHSPGNQSLDQSGVPTRSWKQSAWATDDAQTSNTRKQGRRDESLAQPAAGNSLRKGGAHPFGRRKPEFHKMQISDSGYWEKVFKNIETNGESCRRCTTSGDPSTQNQHINLGNVHVGINEGSDSKIHMGPDFSEIWEVYKNTNFEELQNLFHITQKLVHKQGEIPNVNMIECPSPSWTRSSLAHDQAIKRSKAKVRVSPVSVLCLGKMTDPADANRRWEGQVEEDGKVKFQQTDAHRELFGIDGESIEFKWNIFPGLTSLEIPRKNPERLARTKHWTWRSNHLHVDVQVKNYAKKLSQGHCTFLGLGDEKKWCGTSNYLPENGKTQPTWWWNNSRNLDIQYSKVFLHWLVESWGRRTTRRPYTSMRMLRTQSFFSEQLTLQTSSVSSEQSQDGVKILFWSLTKSLRKTFNDEILKEVQPKELTSLVKATRWCARVTAQTSEVAARTCRCRWESHGEWEGWYPVSRWRV